MDRGARQLLSKLLQQPALVKVGQLLKQNRIVDLDFEYGPANAAHARVPRLFLTNRFSPGLLQV